MKGDTEVLLFGLSMRFKGILFFLKELKCFILHKRKKSTVSGEGVSEKMDSAYRTVLRSAGRICEVKFVSKLQTGNGQRL